MDRLQLGARESEQFATPDSRYTRLGSAVQFAMTFEGGSYLVYDDLGVLSRKQYNAFLLPVTATADIRKSKRRLRVLEHTEQYLPTSWLIDIRGLIFNDPERSDFPKAHDQKRQIMLWDQIADTIQVSGQGFNDLDISELEIVEIAFGQIVGRPDQIPFAIRAESHRPYEATTGTSNG